MPAWPCASTAPTAQRRFATTQTSARVVTSLSMMLPRAGSIQINRHPTNQFLMTRSITHLAGRSCWKGNCSKNSQWSVVSRAPSSNLKDPTDHGLLTTDHGKTKWHHAGPWCHPLNAALLLRGARHSSDLMPYVRRSRRPDLHGTNTHVHNLNRVESGATDISIDGRNAS